ncbi:MAG: hypothetical protein A3C90_03870 [Candidatus Magasanikbacteria bacterium RIFCSPHIGHO2_02_FULL_51_14]|uniref:Uncharacterized protein n=1 Tax=Candidatus Magasanikbacteria bacterium RIFCSPHIGHO2_02_FULL_51_14 TaxID=1798683 RepID=A0A1F6MDT5_9BACT|nr:MAG: hypothetical protein A3C90_03870 [Candidatus Magasanikbacteria bacterium RIFCSPHIGHO2_02_FULL_51_14]
MFRPCCDLLWVRLTAEGAEAYQEYERSCGIMPPEKPPVGEWTVCTLPVLAVYLAEPFRKGRAEQCFVDSEIHTERPEGAPEPAAFRWGVGR